VQTALMTDEILDQSEHAVAQLVWRQLTTAFRLAAPAGFAVSQAVPHVLSVQASSHSTTDTQSALPTHARDSLQQLASRQLSHVPSPLVIPQLGPAPPPPPPPLAPEHELPHVVVAHVESASSFAAPAGCAVSHAEAHAASVQLSSQSRTAVQSASARQALASPQQLVSRHESQVASPLSNPQPLGPPGGGDEGAPHAVAHDVSAHDARSSSSFAPLGWFVKQSRKQLSSLGSQASPHAMSALQSGSAAHAFPCAQQLAPMQASHVASPLETPHVPPPPESTWKPAFFDFATAAMTVGFTRVASVSLECQLEGAAVETGAGAAFLVSVVVVQAKPASDAMAIAPERTFFMSVSACKRRSPVPPQACGRRLAPRPCRS
jgi:hypothetical protein